jgi:hypothetical protein
MWREPVNLERDPPAHGMPGHGKSVRRGFKHSLRHGRYRIEIAVVRASANGHVPKRIDLLLPDRLIADQARQQKKRFYARSSLRIGSLRSRLPVAAKIAFATAGMMVGVLASPIPPGAAWLGTMCTSTTGISSMRSTS